MEVSNQLKNQHLLWRAGFGPKLDDLDRLADSKQKKMIHALWEPSSKPVRTIDATDDGLKDMILGDQGMAMKRKEMTAEERKQFQKQSQAAIKRLNLAWLDEMVTGEDQLREKMSLFWHGHFATRTQNILHQQQLLDTIRRNALGNFGDLLREVSKSGAMINFLNNNQNRKDHPNENFAREVMELFTMGRGNYTEVDVKEAARAFTGWGTTPQGEFQFRLRLHDDGEKTILGKTGNFDGDDVLKILLEHQATARFITRKLYRYLVGERVDDRVEEERVEWLATRFYHHYDIKELLQDIFNSDWFYDPDHIGSRIKSPVDLLVGIRRMLPMKIENEDVLLLVQRLLGQVLFYPPNVAGWPGGQNWIDSSSLMFRLSIPQLVYGSGEIRQKPKDDDDQMMGMHNNPGPDRFGKGRFIGQGRPGQMLRAQIDWTNWLQRFDKVPDKDLFTQISGFVLQTRGSLTEGTLKNYTMAPSREEQIKKMTIQLMSTPEYQLC